MAPFLYDSNEKKVTELTVSSSSGGFVGCLSSKYAFFGDKGGDVFVFHLENLSEGPIHVEKTGTSGIKQVCCNESHDLLVSSNDRCIRLYSVNNSNPPTMISKLKLKDLVNRFHWSTVTFSGDNEYVVAGTQSKEKHNVYIWDKCSGNLLKILEGPSEGLKDLSVKSNLTQVFKYVFYILLVASFSAHVCIHFFIWEYLRLDQ